MTTPAQNPAPRSRLAAIPRGVRVGAMAIGLLLALALVFVLLPRGEQTSLELSSGSAGVISPVGSTTATVGESLRIEVRIVEDDIDWTPGLVVDGEPVTLERSGDIWSYELKVTGPHRVHATYVDFSEGARLLDAATLELLDETGPDGSFLEFSENSEQLASIAADDVISPGLDVGTTEPFLYRVSEVYVPDGGGIGFVTAPASMIDLFDNLSIAAVLPITELPPELAAAVAGPPVWTTNHDGSVINAGLSAALSGDCGVSGVSCNMKIGGNLQVRTPEIDLGIELRGTELIGFRATMRGGLDVGAGFEFTADGSWGGEQQISVHKLPTIWIWACATPPFCAPIAVDPAIELTLGGEAKINTRIAFSGELSTNLSVGPRLDKGEWSLADFSAIPSGEFVPPGEDLSLSAVAYLKFSPEVTVQFLCAAATEIQVPRLMLSASVNADPWWQLDGAALLEKASVSCFDRRLAGWDINRSSDLVRIADAGGPLATATPRPTRSPRPTPSPTPEPSEAPSEEPDPVSAPTESPSGPQPTVGRLGFTLDDVMSYGQANGFDCTREPSPYTPNGETVLCNIFGSPNAADLTLGAYADTEAVSNFGVQVFYEKISQAAAANRAADYAVGVMPWIADLGWFRAGRFENSDPNGAPWLDGPSPYQFDLNGYPYEVAPYCFTRTDAVGADYHCQLSINGMEPDERWEE